jgi:hypothetical protein
VGAARPNLLLLVVAEENANCQQARGQRSQLRRARVGRDFEQLAAGRSQLRSAAKESRRQVVEDFRN